jgi:predicted transcriptional regulator
VRRGRTARDVPPPLELACLNVLWLLGEANVQAVRDHLARTKPLAYTTVMTMLDRLARKELVTRRKSGRSFLYTPAVSRDTIRRAALRELVDSLFDGSPAALAAYAGASRGPFPAEAGAPPAEAQDRIETLDAALL